VSCSERFDETVYLSVLFSRRRSFEGQRSGVLFPARRPDGTDEKIGAWFDHLARVTMAAVASDVSFESRLQRPSGSWWVNDLLEQVADGGDAQALPGHAQAGPMGSLLTEAEPACVLEDLADWQVVQQSHGQDHPANDFVGQCAPSLIGFPGGRKGLANGLRRDNVFQSRQSVQNPARRIGRQRALSGLHRRHSLLGALLVGKHKVTGGRDLRLFQRYCA
jgi:hypothetical protein